MKKTRTLKGLLCAALSTALVLSMSPAAAFAEGNVAADSTELNIFPQSDQSEKMLAANEGANAPFKLLETTSTINVTAPLKLFFSNCEDGFDVNLKDGNDQYINPTAQARFFGNGEDPCRLASITTSAVVSDGKENPFDFTKTGNLQLKVTPMNTNVSNYDPLVVNLNPSTTQTASTQKSFIVNGKSNSMFNFELIGGQDLVKSGLADNGITSREFGNIVYTFACDKAISMFVEDQRNTNNPKDTWIYSLDEVKKHALDIASHNNAVTRAGQTETAEHMYTQFATYPDIGEGIKNYTCKTFLEGSNNYARKNNVFNICILGVNQDQLQQADAMDRTTAGITFMFADVFLFEYLDESKLSYCYSDTDLFGEMSNRNDGRFKIIYDTIGKNNNIVQVKKAYERKNPNTPLVEEDGVYKSYSCSVENIPSYLFTISYTEMTGISFSMIGNIYGGYGNKAVDFMGVNAGTGPLQNEQYMFWKTIINPEEADYDYEDAPDAHSPYIKAFTNPEQFPYEPFGKIEELSVNESSNHTRTPEPFVTEGSDEPAHFIINSFWDYVKDGVKSKLILCGDWNGSIKIRKGREVMYDVHSQVRPCFCF